MGCKVKYYHIFEKSPLICAVAIVVTLAMTCSCQEGNEVYTEVAIPESLKDILTEEAAAFATPLDLQKNFVYYLSGFDEENRPVWVLEIGKWDIRRMIEGGKESYTNFEDFVAQAVFRILNSTLILSTEEDPVSQVVVIADLEGYDLIQLSSVPTVTYILSCFRKFITAFEKIHAIHVVNVNFFAQSIITLVKPILGQEFNKLEVYGANPKKWIPQLLKHVPRDSIPEWYGGAKDFEPVKIYG